MFRFRTLAIVATLAAASAASFAQDDDHKVHHPSGSASMPATAPSINTQAGMPDVARLDRHMKAMQAMHDKMAGAKTSAEREALMAEHMKLMQEGMSMMGGMAPGQATVNAATRQQMMEKRMDMMQSMMQMMMDRMPTSSSATGK